jgi:V/A-type H+-transporting ATPase subunit G/H
VSLDAIQTITAAEEAARRALLDAQAEARRSAEDSERAGRETVDEARTQAEEEIRGMKRELDIKAAERAKELAETTSNRRATLRAHAEVRLNRAAELIVERIVSG